MRILMISSEVAPFAKTGGLADVASALPKELARRGHDVRIVMPRYGMIEPSKWNLKVVLSDIPVIFPALAPVGPSEKCYATILQGTLPGSEVPVYFIDESVLFDRPQLYGREGEDYPDNNIRFAFFSKAVLQMVKALDWSPDIFHCNDWQTGLLPAFLRHCLEFRDDPFFVGSRVLFTVHNLGYQGVFASQMVQWLGLPPEVYHQDGMEFWGMISYLKAGLAYSDHISTVSEQYAREIQTEEFGCGMDGFLRYRKAYLTGILNGVDYSDWNPETDRLIAKNFSVDELSGKAACKEALQKSAGLPLRADVPVIGMVSRLDGQKGLDIIEHALPTLMKLDAQFVFLGTGHPVYHEFFESAMKHHPDKLHAFLGFDNKIAHAIEAGSDAFLMPSRYEPCGLNQMYSLKYGTVPIVRTTGGLADTVIGATAETIHKKTANGFSFHHYSAHELSRTVHRAIDVFHQEPEVWKQIQRTGMEQDFSWSRSAGIYEKLFADMLAEPPHGV